MRFTKFYLQFCFKKIQKVLTCIERVIVRLILATEVGPKRQKLAQAEAEVAEAEATVAAKQAELKEVMDMVADLEAPEHTSQYTV